MNRGITRKLDNLGRICIPKEIRTALQLDTETLIEVSYNNLGITLTKAETLRCQCCGNPSDLIQRADKTICMSCLHNFNQMLSNK